MSRKIQLMPSPDITRRIVPEKQSVTRRRFAAIGASVATTALAGCSAVADFVGGYLLNDVNVFNATNRRIAGSIEITDPDGEVVLDAQFDLAPDGEEQESEDDDSSAIYEEVLTVEGEYAVSVELNEDSEIDGETTAQGTVDVTSLEDDHVTVILGADGATSPITISVIQELSDLEEFRADS